MGICTPWSDYFINNQKNYQNINKKKKMTSCWKYLDHSLNNCEGLTQWAFVPLETTLTQKTYNLNNLRNCLELNQCIDYDSYNHKNPHPCHYLPQSCVGKQIHISGLDMSHWKFTITTEENFQYQWMLIQ